MKGNLDLGKRGEDVALEYLLARGMEFVCRNARAGHKEIDLIFLDGNFIRVVEVKCRIYPYMISPLSNVGTCKQRNLIKATQKLLSKGWIVQDGKKFDLKNKEVTFDVITIVFNGDFYKLNYIQNAFTPNW